MMHIRITHLVLILRNKKEREKTCSGLESSIPSIGSAVASNVNECYDVQYNICNLFNIAFTTASFTVNNCGESIVT